MNDSSKVCPLLNMRYKENFFVGGEYIEIEGENYLIGQSYIEKFVPKEIRNSKPLVFFHGSALTSLCWHETPDGRNGWINYFIDEGFIVYTFEQPARGRSIYNSKLQGELNYYSAELLESLFTATSSLGDWPQAKRHTQWPGTGRMGDKFFDNFYRSTVGFLKSDLETETLVQKAGAALLSEIGEATLITHSQAGNFGWIIAEKCPELVNAIIAIEPIGPPFQNVAIENEDARPWGLSETPLKYDPLIEDANNIRKEIFDSGNASLADGFLQSEPIHSLPNLKDIPTLILSSEASYHARYDHLTYEYLRQAGVSCEHLRLEEKGIYGNGHMMMMEKNNIEIAMVIKDWIESVIR